MVELHDAAGDLHPDLGQALGHDVTRGGQLDGGLRGGDERDLRDAELRPVEGLVQPGHGEEPERGADPGEDRQPDEKAYAPALRFRRTFAVDAQRSEVFGELVRHRGSGLSIWEGRPFHERSFVPATGSENYARSALEARSSRRDYGVASP